MAPEAVSLRTELKPGDVGRIVERHGLLYAEEYGFDRTFEAYVAGPLAKLAASASAGERIWIAETGERFLGCIAIVAVSPRTAQLRWFLVDPAARRQGLGRRLLGEAIEFCRQVGYERIVLWSVSQLSAALRLYQAAGFRRVLQRPGRRWGVDLLEEKHVRVLRTPCGNATGAVRTDRPCDDASERSDL